MMTLSPDETAELLDRDDVTVFPSLYAACAYEGELNANAYDQVVQAFYNL